MMKLIKYIAIPLLILSTIISSCDNNKIPSPEVESVKFYTLNASNEYEEVSNPKKGVTYTIGIKSNADIVVIWPGGERVTVKKKGTQNDSTDINGNVVLSKSNYYSDYGLLKAQGMKTSLNSKIGWTALYKYPTAGEVTLNVIATNHGYDSYEFDQKVFPYIFTIEP